MPSGREHRAWLVAPWLALAAGVALLVQTLRVPFWQDDLLQRAMVVGGFPAHRAPIDLYDFVGPNERTRFVEMGALPWWTDERYQIRFFRPLASLMLYVEHRWLGSAVAMHAISLAWWAGAVLAVGWMFRRVLSPRAAAVAVAVFALAPAHAPALALLAQREVLVTTVFAAVGLGLLARPDEGASWRRLAACAGSFLLAFGAGEYALCFVGYAVLLAAAAPRARRPALASALVPAAVYVSARLALHFGVVGTGFYRDPFVDPSRFLAHAPRSFLALLGDVGSSFDLADAGWPWLIAAGAGTVVLLIAARGCPAWLRVGAVLALVPVMGSSPGQRLVAPALVGVAAAVGVLVERALVEPKRAAATALAIFALGLHVGHAPVTTFRDAAAALEHARAQSDRARAIASLSRPGGTGVVALAAWDTAFFTAVHAASPERMPWRVLVSARHALLLRKDARTVEVVVPRGQGFFPAGTDDIFRPEDDPLVAGDVRDVPGLHVEVLDDGAARSPRIRFTFARDLDDAGFVWLTEKRSGYVPIELPSAGFGLSLAP